jgi:hypothetical protein
MMDDCDVWIGNTLDAMAAMEDIRVRGMGI